MERSHCQFIQESIGQCLLAHVVHIPLYDSSAESGTQVTNHPEIVASTDTDIKSECTKRTNKHSKVNVSPANQQHPDSYQYAKLNRD